MKKILFDYKYKRNFWEASLFFLINVINLVIFGMIFAYVYTIFNGGIDEQFKIAFTPIVSALFVLILSLFVANKKGLIGINKWTGLIVLATWLAYSLAGFAGVVISSIITMAKPNH